METRAEFTRPSSSQDLHDLEQKQIDAILGEALAAVEHVGPRTYRIKLDEDVTECEFAVLGCHGSGKEDQFAVANLMNDNIVASGKKPLFVLFLGDNVYKWGVNSANSEDLQKTHHAIYDYIAPLNELPFFMLLGNHDENFQALLNAKRAWGGQYGYEVGKHEVAHNYVNNPNLLTQLFSEKTLPLNELKKAWVMPYFFYSVKIGNTQIFCLNSNRFLGDFYNYVNHIPGQYPNLTKCPNQVEWLVTAYRKARAKNRQVIIAQHHPLSTDGKRSNPSQFDSVHYYTDAEIRKFNDLLGTKTFSFNQLLAAAFMHLDIFPDAVFAAHDHFIRYAHTTKTLSGCKLPEFTSGGGGDAKLQQRVRLDAYPSVACHFKQHGYGLVTIDPRATTPSTRYHLTGILFSLSPDASLSQREFKQEEARIAKTTITDFEKAFDDYQKYSLPPGHVCIHQLENYLHNAVSQLSQPGELSDVIETPQGFVVLKLISITHTVDNKSLPSAEAPVMGGFKLDIFTVEERLHLKFNDKSSLPICIPSEDPLNEAFKKRIRACCDNYLNELKNKQQPITNNYNDTSLKTLLYGPMTLFNDYLKDHPIDEKNMVIVHNIVGLIDQYQSLPYTELKERVLHLTNTLGDKENPNSIYQQLNKIINPMEQLTTYHMVNK